MRALLVLGLTIAASGCLRGDLPKEIVEGERVRYFHDADHAPCANVVPRIDRFVDDLDEHFGLELPAGFRFNYFHVEDPETGDDRIPEICGGPVSACTQESGIYSSEWAHLHEILHAVLIPSGGAPPVFNEGLAHIVDCGPHRFTGTATSREPRLEDVLTRASWDEANGDLDGSLRQGSASFVRFLIETHGARDFGAFLKASARGDDEDRVRENFDAHLGGDLDDALAAWRASDLPLERGERCLFFDDACDDAPALDALATSSVDLEGACLPEVVVVDAPAGTDLHVRARSDEVGLSATVFPCDRFERDDPVIRQFFYESPVPEGSETHFTTPLTAGRWAITVEPAHERGPTEATLELELTAPVSGCASAPTINLDDEHTAFTAAGPALAAENVWRVSLDEETGLLRGTIGPARWRACDDACPLTNCRSLGEGPLAPGDYRLALQLEIIAPVWGALAVAP
jgi:hypothetical protein